MWPDQQAQFIPTPGRPHLLCPLAGTCSPGVYMAHWLTSTRFALMSLQRTSPQTLWEKLPLPPPIATFISLPLTLFFLLRFTDYYLTLFIIWLPGMELLQGQEFCA